MEDRKYFIFTKDENIKLSDNFSSKEFKCNCSNSSCKEQKISVLLIEKLQKVRKKLGQSIKITSGYRCEQHNIDIGGAKQSQHINGNAADIKCNDMDKLDTLCNEEFMSIGDDKPVFLHVDTRSDKKRRWTY